MRSTGGRRMTPRWKKNLDGCGAPEIPSSKVRGVLERGSHRPPEGRAGQAHLLALDDES